MNLRDKRILVTGAAGGIGSELVAALIEEEAHVLLTGRDHAALQRVAARCEDARGDTAVFAADLDKPRDRAGLCAFATQWHGGIDMLINNAGVGDFNLLHQQSAESIQATLTTNLLAPIDLCRQLVPYFSARDEAHIVNIGSVFGHLGFAANSVYCASKFGLRGFSEALRRELADSSIRVHYFAPRATHTKLNTGAVDEMNEVLGNASDNPADVARAIVQALRADRLESIIGWPEKFFARLNAILPRAVDAALRKKLPTIRRYAQRGATIARPAIRISEGASNRRAV
jgi:short-subunit dehydrogenase